MKICFVQPDTDYQIKKHRHALALTFPQLISDLNIEETEYIVYIFGKTKDSFEDFLKQNAPTHVFVTAITSTFPYAEMIANIAKEYNCIVVLGGIFASINYQKICENFRCFDYIVAGHPDYTLISHIISQPTTPKYIIYNTSSNYKKELGEIITDYRFRQYYSEDETVCYELKNGCYYHCSFCSMRHAFPNQKPIKRSLNIIQNDIHKLSSYWKKIKLIDDDISFSIEILKQLNLNMFEEVVAETRLDNICEYNMQIFNAVGITHLIVGVESFDTEFLTESSKTKEPRLWHRKIQNAIMLCQKYNITIRPVIMITHKYADLEKIKQMESYLSGWTPKNNVEALCSFYTPHPGMASSEDYRGLLTNNLKYFDHIHCVWLPPMIDKNQKNKLLEIYTNITEITESYEYNPILDFSFNDDKSYECFFE